MSDEPMRGELVWNGGLRFTARHGGNETSIDGRHEAGGSPMELLLASLAGCMAIDLVLILEKRRAEIRSLRTQVTGVRAAEPPRRFTEVTMRFEIAGAGVRPADVERAIQLSREKYCSVFATLRPDLEVKITYAMPQD